MESLWLKYCDECHVFGTSCRDYLRRQFPRLSVCAIPLTMDESRIAAVANLKTRLYDVLFTGNLNIEYIRSGIVSLLTSPDFEKLLRSNPELKVAIHSTATDALAELKKGCNFDQVSFLGPVDNFLSLLQESKILIFPDQGGTGLKTRVVAGAALEKPIVGFHWVFEGLPLQHGADCFQGENTSDLVGGLKLLLEDPNRQEMMGRNAKMKVNSYCGFESVRKQWDNLLFPVAT